MARQQRKSISRAPVDVDHQVVVAEIDHLATGPRVAAEIDHPATDPRVVADSDLREIVPRVVAVGSVRPESDLRGVAVSDLLVIVLLVIVLLVAVSDLREVLVVTARLVKALADPQRQSNTLRSAI